MTAEMDEQEVSLRCTAYELVKGGGEVYCNEVVDAWAENPYPEIRSARGYAGRVLRAMEEDGELDSRLVHPDEHQQSQLMRRYYRLAWEDES